MLQVEVKPGGGLGALTPTFWPWSSFPQSRRWLELAQQTGSHLQGLLSQPPGPQQALTHQAGPEFSSFSLERPMPRSTCAARPENLRASHVHVRTVPGSELVVAKRVQAGLDEHALHGAPPVVLVGGPHAVDLPLAPDGVAVLLARHTQVHVRAHVLEAHGLVTLPVVAVALDAPHVQVVAFAVLPKRADLLWGAGGASASTFCAGRQPTAYLVVGQGRAEMVAVEVPARLHVRDADGLTAADGRPPRARTLGLPPDLPVAVSVVGGLHPGH